MTSRSLAVRAFLRYLASTKRPIIIGPWRSELGFEVLYWLPFLSWAIQYAKIPKERCYAVSRGGMGALYPTAGQVDLYTLLSNGSGDTDGVDALRLQNQIDAEANLKRKQIRVTAWDRDVCRKAAAHLGLTGGYHVLHPSWMYWLFDDFWEERASARLIMQHTQYEPMATPTLPEGLTLPWQFLAVRFYERYTFPLKGHVRELAIGITQALAQHVPVILLNQPVCTDDHVDLPIAGDNIFTLPIVPPEQNFILQAAVLARAAGFVGTYGGIAQWALRYGKPSVSFYTEFQGTSHAHRAWSSILSAQTKVPFEVSSLKAFRLWQMATGVPVPKNEARGSSVTAAVPALV